VREAGVSLSGISTTAEPTGVALVTVADGGENTIVVVPGANATLDAAAVEGHAEAIGGAAVVLLQGEIPRSGIEAAARLATGRVVLNLAPVIELEPAVFRRADPLVVNEHEAVLALKLLAPGMPLPGETQPEEAQPASEEALAAGLLRAGVPAVVLTLGARGALCADASGISAYPAPAVEAVDTTGAGDAFVGALGARLAAGDSLQAAAAFAVRVGAFAVQSAGAQPSFPTLADRLPC
jgi:ribokinase